MPLRDDFPKSKTNAQSLGSTKGSGPAKGTSGIHGAGSTKAAQPVKAGGKPLQPDDVKSLVENHGKAKFGSREWVLKAPSWSDSVLQAIISDPEFTVKPAGKPAVDGKWVYELRGHGKTINLTIGH
ncbi:MAG: hypothetical protein K0R76_1373 [Alphaproteobacteria bacterium]|jgi:hypothetical protein|nr:hypothetical protein [Alphaproteobacteria bacterium]MDF3034419.1 hypothetical protein [Alphaproteobacteria bacterium]